MKNFNQNFVNTQLKTILEIKNVSGSSETQTFFDTLDLAENGKSFAGFVDPDEFFTLGKLLRDSGTAKNIHIYLDIFRQKSFLTMINQEDRWSQLILELKILRLESGFSRQPYLLSLHPVLSF